MRLEETFFRGGEGERKSGAGFCDDVESFGDFEIVVAHEEAVVEDLGTGFFDVEDAWVRGGCWRGCGLGLGGH